MFQVLVRTTPYPVVPPVSYTLASREAAEVFVQRSDVWWWIFPLDEDAMDGGSWRKGGAWAPAGSPLPVADSIAVEDYLDTGDDADDDGEDRW